MLLQKTENMYRVYYGEFVDQDVKWGYIFKLSIKTTVKYFVEILLFLSILYVFSILK